MSMYAASDIIAGSCWVRCVPDVESIVQGVLGAIEQHAVGNESVPIQLTQCRFPELAISRINILFK